MNQREARRMAHRWVTDVLDGALANGSEDGLLADLPPADYARVKAEIETIQMQHWRKANPDR